MKALFLIQHLTDDIIVEHIEFIELEGDYKELDFKQRRIYA